MKLVISILIITGMIATSSVAQSYEFRVLASKGKNEVMKDKTGAFSPLKTGATLFMSSVLKVGESSYLGLMHKSGKTMEIKKSGIYNISDLAKRMDNSGSSMASQYGEYLLSKMNSSGDEDVSKSRLNNLNVTGAVSRAITGEEIHVFLPKTSKVLSMDETLIKWQSIETDSYFITIDNLFGETIYEKKIEFNYLNLVDLGMNLDQEGGVFIKITDASNSDNASIAHAIEPLNGAHKKKVQEDFNRLLSEMTTEDLSLKKLVMAMFYEENELYLHAFSCYHEVLQEYPDVDFYKSAYLGFVERNKEKFK